MGQLGNYAIAEWGILNCNAAMRSPHLVVVTITLSRNPAEETALLNALTVLRYCGLPVIAADAHSSAKFTKELRGLHFDVVTPRRRGLVPQVKAGLRQALLRYPGKFVLYTEPDKYPFFAGRLYQFLRQLTRTAKLGVGIPARDLPSFGTFPLGQQWTESFTNEATNLCFGGNIRDYCYGPLLLSRRAVEFALEAPDELGWGWRFYAMARTHQAGLQLRAVEMDLPCPAEQRKEDSRSDRMYRLKQMRQNLSALALVY